MKSKIYLTIVISSILAFALIATAIPTTSVSAIVHEGLMGEDQGGNMTEGGETGGMTEGQTSEDTGITEGQ